VSETAPAAWLRDLGAGLRELWLPLAIGALLVFGTYALWHLTQTREQAAFDALARSEAGRVEEELGRALDRDGSVLERFVAERGSWAAVTAVSDSEVDRLELPFRAVLVLDPALQVLRAHPAMARATSAARPDEDDARTVALRVITEIPGHAAAMVGTVPLAGGGRQLLVCVPVFEGGRPQGFVVGVLRVQDLLDGVLEKTVQRGFAVSVYEGPEFIFGTQLADVGPGYDYERETAVARDAIVWRVQVWPADDFFKTIDSHGPILLFLAGLVLAFFVSLTVYLWRERATGDA